MTPRNCERALHHHSYFVCVFREKIALRSLPADDVTSRIYLILLCGLSARQYFRASSSFHNSVGQISGITFPRGLVLPLVVKRNHQSVLNQCEALVSTDWCSSTDVKCGKNNSIGNTLYVKGGWVVSATENSLVSCFPWRCLL